MMSIEAREAIYAEVAAEAFDAMNETMAKYRKQNPMQREQSDYDDSETYLYVFEDGNWTIDHAQYIPSTNGCISNVPLAFYGSVAELADDLKANEDWAFEDEEGDDE